MRRNKVCNLSISIRIYRADLTKMNASEVKVQLHCSLATMLPSPISVSAATSELLVALPVPSHEFSMAVLHFSTSPPLSLSMLSRKEYSIPSSRPSSCQSVRPRRVFLIASKCEVSRRTANNSSLHWRAFNVNRSSFLILTQSFCWEFTLGCWQRRFLRSVCHLHLLNRGSSICACVHG